MITKHSAASDAAYNKIDGFLRRTFEDADYKNFSEALDTLVSESFGEGVDHERARLVRSIQSLATSISLGLEK